MMKCVIAKTQKEITDNFLVRGMVFVIEQKIAWEIEFDGLDDRSILFTAYLDDIPVGAGRLYQYKIGRVSTLKEYRKMGIGALIVEEIEKFAKRNKFPFLKLHSQVEVMDFYINLGYEAMGDIFKEADIDHILMKKTMI